MDCIFCKILDKKIPADFIYQDKNFGVFKDIKPDAPVHLLIVPKKHITSVKELAPKDGALIAKLILLAKKVAQKQGLDGYKLVFNVGRGGGQLIDHIHLHLLGGWKEKNQQILHI